MKKKSHSNGTYISKIRLICDGCCKGNPGPGAVGIVLFDQTASEVARIAQTIGWTTVNRAEYEALILGLDQAAKFTRKHVTCLLDNDVVAGQINGRYRLRNDELRALYHRVKELERPFLSVEYHQVPRTNQNMSLVHRLGNQALNGQPI